MHRYLIWLLIILFVKAAVMIGVILFAGIGLGPDEAQYWTWSQLLDWGYYSKPPGIAWQIWLGTKLFGNTELGVRFFSVVLSFFISIAVYILALACRCQPRTAFWAGVVMALTPLGVLSSLFAITDVGMTLFWTCCCIVIAEALYQRRSPNYYLLGLFIALGALFKWPIYFFWLLVIISIPFWSFLFSRHIVVGLAISLLGLLPSFIWNSQHDWMTFRHVTSAVSESVTKANALEFLGAQALLLSPILFILLFIAGIHLINKKIPAPIAFCGFSSLGLIIIFTCIAIFKKLQGNWIDFVYPSGIVFLCWYALEYVSWGNIWLKIGIIFSIFLCVFGLSIKLPYKFNPFKHNLGWDNLSHALTEVGYDPQKHFLFGDKYQTSSVLSFYGPGQKRAYFLNLHGIRRNQFSFWPSMSEEQMGKTGYFVLPESGPDIDKDIEVRIAFYKGALSQYFKKVEFMGIKPILNKDKGAFIFKGEGYNGLQPANTDLY